MPVLDSDEIQRRLGDRPGWRRDGDTLRREFVFADFAASVAFVNRIATVADQMNHHPDVSISWNRVALTLSTHSEGGVTDSDLTLAQRIDPLA